MNQLLLADINDDCLLHIFKTLDLADLINIAETCIRFKTLACSVFKSLDMVFCTRVLWDQYDLYPEDIYRLLRNFGSLITRINVNLEIDSYDCEDCDDEYSANRVVCMAHCNQRTILNLIYKYCGENLRSLVLTMNRLYDIDIIDNVQPQFTNLQYLQLHVAYNPPSLPNLYSIFSDCKHLVELVANTPYILDYKFPKLEKLAFFCFNNSSTAIIDFLSIHKNLTTLNYRSFVHRIDIDTNNLQQLSEIRELRDLKLDCDQRLVLLFINNLGCNLSLERIECRSVTIDNDFVDGIEKMVNLRVLTLKRIKSIVSDKSLFEALGGLSHLSELTLASDCWNNSLNFNGAGLVNMVTRLNKLKNISFEKTGLVLGSDHYDSLVEICRNREENIKLFITNNERYQHDIPQSKDENNKSFVEYRYDESDSDEYYGDKYDEYDDDAYDHY